MLNFLDRCLVEVDRALKTLTVKPSASADWSDQMVEDSPMTAHEKKQSAALMRVNHCGEVCAQALYRAQAWAAHSPKLSQKMLSCAMEENNHLAWCHERLEQLDAHVSYLNPLWYAGSFCIGAFAAWVGDAYSLGFVAETEKQVGAHLAGHLNRLPKSDQVSRLIIQKMQEEEAMHEQMAHEQGACDLPGPVAWLMGRVSRIMTAISYYI